MNFTLINIPLYNSNTRLDIQRWYQQNEPGQKVQKIGLTPNVEADKSEAEELRTDSKPETLIKQDNPKNYLRTVSNRAALLHRHEINGNPLGLEEPRSGWYAQHYEVVGHTTDENFDGVKVVQSYGDEIKYRSASPALLQKRLSEELGFNGFDEYAEAIHRLKETRLNYIGNDSDPAKEVEHIKKLHAEIKNDTCFSSTGAPIPKSLILAQLIDRVSRLEEGKIEANDNGDGVKRNAYQSALDKLKSDLELKLDFRDNFVFARQAKGMTLMAPQLGLVIKKAGAIPSHRVNTDGEINFPEAINNSVVITTRGQIADRIKENTEILAKALNVNSGLYVFAGIETQEIVEGQNLNDLLSGNPNLLTKPLYEKLVKIALTHELLDFECTDWSLHNFMVQGNVNGGFELKLVDLGNSSKITEVSGDMDKRLTALGNIGDSARANKDIIKEQMSKLYEEIITNPSILKRLISEVKDDLKTKQLLIEE